MVAATHPRTFIVPLGWEHGEVVSLSHPGLVERVHRAGQQVVFYTPNSEAELSAAWASGCDGVISDYPDRAARLRRDAGL